MDAGKRIEQAFRGDPGELVEFLGRVELNATTSLAMMFQNPAVPTAQEAVEESISQLLLEAGGHCQDARLDKANRDAFMNAHHKAVARFREAFNRALESGIHAADRAALAIRIAQLLQLPT